MYLMPRHCRQHKHGREAASFDESTTTICLHPLDVELLQYILPTLLPRRVRNIQLPRRACDKHVTQAA